MTIWEIARGYPYEAATTIAYYADEDKARAHLMELVKEYNEDDSASWYPCMLTHEVIE